MSSTERSPSESDDTRLEAAKEVLGELLVKRRLEPPTVLLRLADRFTGYTAVIANLCPLTTNHRQTSAGGLKSP